jgi:hypothetical protein
MVPGAIWALGLWDDGALSEIEDAARLDLDDIARHHCSLRFDFSPFDLDCVHADPIPVSQGSKRRAVCGVGSPTCSEPARNAVARDSGSSTGCPALNSLRLQTVVSLSWVGVSSGTRTRTATAFNAAVSGARRLCRPRTSFARASGLVRRDSRTDHPKRSSARLSSGLS